MYENTATQSYPEARDATAVAMTPVAEALDQLADAEKRLHFALERLTNRLDPLLAPPSPEKDSGATARPCASELHGRLLGDVSRVDDAVTRVDRLIARLTV